MSEFDEETGFRKNALMHQQQPNELGDLVAVTNPGAWILASAIAIIVFVAIGWVLFGKVVTQVDGVGLLLPKNGFFVSVSAPQDGGYVNILDVKVGDKVKRGQTLAVLVSPNLFSQIDSEKNQIKQLQTQYEKLKNEYKSEREIKEKSYKEKTEQLKSIILLSEQNQEKIKDLIEINKEAYDKKLISREKLIDSEVQYNDLQNAITTNEQAILDLDEEYNDFNDKWQERLRSLDEKISDKQGDTNILIQKAKVTKVVVSPIDAIVAEVHSKVGDYVDENNTLINLTSDGDGLFALAFIKAEKGKMIDVGMSAKVTPSTIKKIEYGSIEGTVTIVSPDPISTKGMQSLLKNENLVTDFLKNGPVIGISVRLDQDKNTVSGYRWTSSLGPDFKITRGTLVNVSVVTERKAPISFIIPRLKKLFD